MPSSSGFLHVVKGKKRLVYFHGEHNDGVYVINIYLFNIVFAVLFNVYNIDMKEK